MKPSWFSDCSGWKIHLNTARSGLTGEVAVEIDSIAELAQHKALEEPETVAFVFDDGSKVTYSDIFSEAQEIALGLKNIGFSPGDTISFQLPNWRESVAISIAACILDLVVNPITPICRASELRLILEDSKSKLIFIPSVYRSFNYEDLLSLVSSELPNPPKIIVVRGNSSHFMSYEGLRNQERETALLPRRTNPDAVKLVMYTSGTTGRAKGVLHTHSTIDNSPLIGSHDGTTRDVILIPSPVTHLSGYLLGLELPFRANFCAVLMDSWQPSVALKLINDHGVTHAAGATIFLKELLDEAEHKHDRLPTLRVFGCGGASVTPELVQRAARVTERCSAYRGYGATEAPNVSGMPADFVPDLPTDALDWRAVTDGRILGYDVKIIGPKGEILSSDREGEIRVRGLSLFVGYTDEKETIAAFDEEGFFRTGDLGMVTSDNEIVVTGRLKDLIIRGGENLSPLEIENAIEKHPAVLESAVVSMPHPRLGEAVCAFVITRDEAQALSLVELMEFLDVLGLARQKFPERLEFAKSFPRTASGKIRKDVLRASLRERPIVRHQ